MIVEGVGGSKRAMAVAVNHTLIARANSARAVGNLSKSKKSMEIKDA